MKTERKTAYTLIKKDNATLRTSWKVWLLLNLKINKLKIMIVLVFKIKLKKLILFKLVWYKITSFQKSTKIDLATKKA